MASSKEYVAFILDLFQGVEGISSRPMMGETLLYYRGKIIGGIYDNRFLIKPTESAKIRLPAAPYKEPYAGAKEMLLVENLEDRAFLKELVAAMSEELPAPKPKKKK